MYGRAMAFQEIESMLSNADVMARNLSEQINNPDKNYAIG